MDALAVILKKTDERLEALKRDRLFGEKESMLEKGSYLETDRLKWAEARTREAFTEELAVDPAWRRKERLDGDTAHSLGKTVILPEKALLDSFSSWMEPAGSAIREIL